MNINDILKLNNEVESLNIIQEFLTKTITHEDYEKAIYIYLKIAYFNNLNDLIINEGSKSLIKVKDQEPTKYRELIYSYLIEATINLKQYELTKEYIEKRKELLPILERYLSLLDELKLAKATNSDFLNILLNLKNEILPLDINIFVLEELLEYYRSHNLFQNALDILEELKLGILKVEYDEIYIELIYQLGEYVKVVDQASKDIEKENCSTKIIVYYIAALIKINKLNYASTLEAEYEIDFDDITDQDFKIFAFETMIKLYTLLDNKISIDLYSKKIQKINRQVKKIIKETPIVEKEIVKIKEVQTQSLISNAKYLEHFDWVLNWFITSHKLDLKLTLREYLRQMFIIINEKVSFKEAILYVNENYESNFYNFKKERLYDKKIIKQYIDETIINDTLKKQDNILGNVKSLISKKDVLTQDEFDDSIKFIYSFYINKNTVLAFYLEEELIDYSLYYELFSGISYIINTRLIDEENIKSLQSNARDLTKMFDNKVIAVRKMNEYQSRYNSVATKMFNIDEVFHLELFLRQMSLTDAKQYEKAVERLFNYPNETNIQVYKFNNLTIKEYLFASKENEKVIIYSYFIDISEFFLNEENLITQATVCNETKLKNKYSLTNELENYLNNKTTFVLIELNHELSSIYGNELMNQFFIEFSAATSKHFINQDVFRYDFNQIMVVFDFNDIRSINKELDNYFLVINHLKSLVLKYEKYNIKAGVLRYPVVTVEKNINKLFRYLDVSLQKAKNSADLNYVHFIQADFEKEIFEQEVIDYINTAIENKQLSIKFKQIIDIEKNLVWNYESIIYLPNITIDLKYLTIIAKRRKKLVDLELYHIEAVCSFLKELKKNTSHLVRLTIPISYETFSSPNFISYLTGTLKRYEVPAEFIRILINLKNTSSSDSLKIDELIKYGISVDSTYVETVLNNDCLAIHLKLNKLTNKQKNYYKMINEFLKSYNVALIIKEVNTKEAKDVLKTLGITYIEGNIYQEILPNELITKIKDTLK